MPKADVLRVIDDNTTNVNATAGASSGFYSSSRIADLLDGFDASLTPGPLLIPVAQNDGKLHPGWLPQQKAASEGAATLGGQIYIAPWARLVENIAHNSHIMRVNAPIFAVGDKAVLAHYDYGNEEINVTGGPVTIGDVYEYTIQRGANSRFYPAQQTTVINLGNERDGGYIVIVSGDQQDRLRAPHINMYAARGGNFERVVRLGRLSGLSSSEKARFPEITNWDMFGLYADSAILKGHFVAESGRIAGDLRVDGDLRVMSGIGLASFVIGSTASGYGAVLYNREGSPIFGAVSPYVDGSGNLHDVAVFLDNEGKPGLFYHRDAVTGKYRLDIAVETLIDGYLRAERILLGQGEWGNNFTGLVLGRQGIQSYGPAQIPQIEWNTADGRFYAGNREVWLDSTGLTFDVRDMAENADEFENAVHWLAKSNTVGDYYNAVIGSDALGNWFVVARRPLRDVLASIQEIQAIDSFVEAALYLRPGGKTSLQGDLIEIAGSAIHLASQGRNLLRVENDTVYIDSLLAGRSLRVSDDIVRINANDSNATLTVGGENRIALRLINEAANTFFDAKVSFGNINLSSSASLWYLAPNRGSDGNAYILPGHSFVSLGNTAQPYRAVYAAQGHFGSLGSQTLLSGIFYLSGRKATLAVPLEPGNEIAYFVESNLRRGEYIRFEDIYGNWEIIRIENYNGVAGEFHEYQVVRAVMAQGNAGYARFWAVGTVGVSLGGNETDGYIRLWGTDDNNPNTGPAIVIFQRISGETPDAVDTRAVFGNLNGWYRYNENVFGVAMGDVNNAWAVVEPTGLRIMYADKQKALYGETVRLGEESGFSIAIVPHSIYFYNSNVEHTLLNAYGLYTDGSLHFREVINGNKRLVAAYEHSDGVARLYTCGQGVNTPVFQIQILDGVLGDTGFYGFYRTFSFDMDGFYCDYAPIHQLALPVYRDDALSYQAGCAAFARTWKRWFIT